MPRIASTEPGLRVEYDVPGSRVDMGLDYVLPGRFEATVRVKSLPYDVHLVAVFEDERFVCEQMHVRRREGGPPVKTALVQRLPIAGLIRRAAERLLMRHDAPEAAARGGSHRVVGPVDLTTQDVFEHGPARLGPDLVADGPTDAALRAIATVYRLAHACGEPPTLAVQERFGLARSTAGRWVSKARERGLLDPTTPGRAAAGGAIEVEDTRLRGVVTDQTVSIQQHSPAEKS